MSRIARRLLAPGKSKTIFDHSQQFSVANFRSPMNLQFSTLAVALASSSAWTQVPNFPRGISLSHAFRSFHDVALHATVVSDSTSSPALEPQGKHIADGHVVAAFQGGLIAIRVNEDISEVLAAGSPEVVDTTKLLPKNKPSSSFGGDLIGHQVSFQNGRTGLVVAYRPPIAFVYTDMESVDDVEGDVKVLDSLANVKVDENQKVVDCLGRPQNGDEIQGNSQRPIFAPIPKVSDISLINTPLLTGVTMFDALAPIGKGQNMLMIGHDIKDMRHYVCDMLSAQAKSVKCIYASTTGDDEVSSMLSEAGLADDVILVTSKKSSGNDQISMAAQATVTAATACSIAESLALEKGMNTVVVVDTIDEHKKLWDATTRVLVDVFGVDSVVKGDRDGGASSEMRAFFSSLIQRAAKFNIKKGAGSVTLVLLVTIPKMEDGDEDQVFSPEDFANSPAKVRERIELLVKRNVPLTAANLRKIQIPVLSDAEGFRRLSLQHVDDLISMSDGQIWLDEELEKKGRRPPMDFQRSVTRIGIGADTKSRADAPAMRKVVEGLRLDLSQALDMDGADISSNASIKQARSASSWLLAMHQPSANGARRLSESCVVLLAASKGYLGDSVDSGVVAGTKAGDELISGLFNHVNTKAAVAMEIVDRSQDLTDENLESIESAIESYFSQ